MGVTSGEVLDATVAWRTRARALAPIGVPLLAAALFAAVHLRGVDHPLVWTDVSAIGERTMIRPRGEIARAFVEPLHRIQFRDDVAVQAYYRPLQVVLLSVVAPDPQATRGASDAATASSPDERGRIDARGYRIATVAAGAVCMAVWGVFTVALLPAGAALFAALFVAAHPAAVESTVWISGSSGTLCAAFAIAALGLALRGAASRGSRGIALGVASTLALVGALLSKERAAVEPLLLGAAWIAGIPGRVAFGRARRAAGDPRRRALVLLGVHVCIVAGYLLAWRPFVLGAALPPLAPIGGEASTQLLTSIASWPASIAWVFAPLESTTSDVVAVVEEFAEPRVWGGVVVALGSAAIALGLLWAGRPIAAFGMAWVWIAFAPTSGILPMLHATGERYRFLSVFGAALVLADLVPALLRRLGERPGLLVGAALALIAVVGLTGRTWTRLADWRSTETLFGPAVAREPAYREAYFLLAANDLAESRPDRAATRLATLLDEPEIFAGTSSYINWQSVYELACVVELVRGRPAAARELHARALRRHPSVARSPTFLGCIVQASTEDWRDPAGVETYMQVAEVLGREAPPKLLVTIARKLIGLERGAEALAWLDRVGPVPADRPKLARQIDNLRGLANRQVRAGR